jgi:hypothetical protein
MKGAKKRAKKSKPALARSKYTYMIMMNTVAYIVPFFLIR